MKERSYTMEEEQEIHLLDLIAVLVKRRLLILVLSLLAAGGSVAYSVTLPNIYSSTAKVILLQRDDYVSLGALMAEGSTKQLVIKAPIWRPGGGELLLEILKSDLLKERIVKRVDLQKVYGVDSPDVMLRRLGNVVKVNNAKEGYISITAEEKNPRLAAVIANVYVEELGQAAFGLNLTSTPVVAPPDLTTNVSDSKGGVMIRLLDKARPSALKVKPNRSQIVSLATLLAFFVSVFLAFLLEYFSRLSGEEKARWENIKAELWGGKING